MRTSEDWWAVWVGALLLIVMFALVWFARPANFAEQLTGADKIEISHPLEPYIDKPGKWTDNPVHSLVRAKTGPTKAVNTVPGIAGAFLIIGLLFALAMKLRGLS